MLVVDVNNSQKMLLWHACAYKMPSCYCGQALTRIVNSSHIPLHTQSVFKFIRTSSNLRFLCHHCQSQIRLISRGNVLNDIFFVRVPFAPDIFGTLWLEWLIFPGQYSHYIGISVVYSLRSQLGSAVSARLSAIASVVDYDPGL